MVYRTLTPASASVGRSLLEPDQGTISVRRQCELLGVNRSGLYYEPVGESEENRLLMRMLPRRKHRLDDNESGWA